MISRIAGDLSGLGGKKNPEIESADNRLSMGGGFPDSAGRTSSLNWFLEISKRIWLRVSFNVITGRSGAGLPRRLSWGGWVLARQMWRFNCLSVLHPSCDRPRCSSQKSAHLIFFFFFFKRSISCYPYVKPQLIITRRRNGHLN